MSTVTCASRAACGRRRLYHRLEELPAVRARAHALARRASSRARRASCCWSTRSTAISIPKAEPFTVVAPRPSSVSRTSSASASAYSVLELNTAPQAVLPRPSLRAPRVREGRVLRSRHPDPRRARRSPGAPRRRGDPADAASHGAAPRRRTHAERGSTSCKPAPTTSGFIALRAGDERARAAALVGGPPRGPLPDGGRARHARRPEVDRPRAGLLRRRRDRARIRAGTSRTGTRRIGRSCGTATAGRSTACRAPSSTSAASIRKAGRGLEAPEPPRDDRPRRTAPGSTPATASSCSTPGSRRSVTGRMPSRPSTTASASRRRRAVLYLQLGDRSRRFGNPFETGRPQSFFAWLNEPIDRRTDIVVTRLWHAIHAATPAMRAAFPDLLGQDRLSFANWTAHHGGAQHGVDAELVPELIDAEGLPASRGVRMRRRLYRRVVGAGAAGAEAARARHGRPQSGGLAAHRPHPHALDGRPAPARRARHSRAHGAAPGLGVNVAGYAQSGEGRRRGDAQRAPHPRRGRHPVRRQQLRRPLLRQPRRERRPRAREPVSGEPGARERRPGGALRRHQRRRATSRSATTSVTGCGSCRASRTRTSAASTTSTRSGSRPPSHRTRSRGTRRSRSSASRIPCRRARRPRSPAPTSAGRKTASSSSSSSTSRRTSTARTRSACCARFARRSRRATTCCSC